MDKIESKTELQAKIEKLIRFFRWRIVGLGWPVKDLPGYACVFGGLIEGDRNAATFYLLAEYESDDLESLCRQVLDFDFSYGPEFIFADVENDAAAKTLYQLNESSKRVLAGKQYELGGAPWNRRTVHLSSSRLYEMNEGYQSALITIRGLLKADRLFFEPDSIISQQLLTIGRQDDLKLQDAPIIAAVGSCITELADIESNAARRRQNRPPAKASDRLRKYR